MSDPRHLGDQELLQSLDQELPSRRQAVVETHLEQCLVCRTRREQIDGAASEFSALHRASQDLDVPPSREPLRRRLQAEPEPASWRWWLSSSLASAPRWAIAGLVLATAALVGYVSADRRLAAANDLTPTERDTLPLASLTPGATWSLNLGELCESRAREQRPVPAAVRLAVLRGYGMEGVPDSEYELDYLITPELGGAPDARNLWPQRYAARVWNARVKDQLEQLLPRLVCDRQVELATAQREIADNWISAYKKYFKTDAPLRIQAELLDDDQDSGLPNRVMYPVWRSADAAPLQLIPFGARR